MKAVVPDPCLSKTVRCHSLVRVLTLDRLLILLKEYLSLLKDFIRGCEPESL